MEQFIPWIVAAIAMLLLVLVWSQSNNLKSRILELEENNDKDSGDTEALHKVKARVRELESELKSAKANSSKTTSSKASPKREKTSNADSAPTLSKAQHSEIQQLKSDLNDRNKQIESLKKETRTLQGKVQKLSKSSPKQRAKANDLLALREELMEAKTDAENFKTRALKAEKALEKQADQPPAPAPVVQESPSPQVDSDALEASHQSALKDLEGKQQKALKDLRSSHKKDLKEVKSELVAELKSVRAELRKARRDVDEQRRRARNNDKAYKITKLQLDAMREKLALIDPDTIAPGGYFDPESEAKRIQKAREEQSDRNEEAQQQAAASALAALTNLAPSPSLPSVSEDPLTKLGIEPVSLEDDWGLGTPSLDELLSSTDLNVKDS